MANYHHRVVHKYRFTRLWYFYVFEIFFKKMFLKIRRAYNNKNILENQLWRAPCLGAQHCVCLGDRRCLTVRLGLSNMDLCETLRMTSITTPGRDFSRGKPVMHMNELDIHTLEYYQMKRQWGSNIASFCCNARQPWKKTWEGRPEGPQAGHPEGFFTPFSQAIPDHPPVVYLQLHPASWYSQLLFNASLSYMTGKFPEVGNCVGPVCHFTSGAWHWVGAQWVLLNEWMHACMRSCSGVPCRWGYRWTKQSPKVMYVHRRLLTSRKYPM